MGLIRADSPGEVGWRKTRIQMDKKKTQRNSLSWSYTFLRKM